MNLTPGKTVYYIGTNSLFIRGTVLRMHGPKLVKVAITASITEQNFLTGKTTRHEIGRSEFWPVNKISITKPEPEPEPA